MAKQPTKKQREFSAQLTELRRWSIQAGITPPDRYRLGPTGTWHPASHYFQTIMPLWCPLSSAWNVIPRLPPASSFFALARGGILETNYTPMRNTYTGKAERLYVKDSEKTRDILIRLQDHTLRHFAWQFVKTRLVQQTFEEGWLALFAQVVALKRKLDKPTWRDQLDGMSLNIPTHIKVGQIIDNGQMPPDLMLVALRLISVWLQEYLIQKHESGGMILRKSGRTYQRILVVYGHHQLVAHHKVRLTEFYRANLYQAPARFVHRKRLPDA